MPPPLTLVLNALDVVMMHILLCEVNAKHILVLSSFDMHVEYFECIEVHIVV
jgi:hypothetical protein